MRLGCLLLFWLGGFEVTALEEIKKGATQKEIAAAWSAWQSRHGGKLGPGPAFVEAINAALAIRLPALESLQSENEELVLRANEAVEAANALQVRAEAAESEVRRLREALEGIANPKVVQSFGDPVVLRDAARAVLASTGGLS